MKCNKCKKEFEEREIHEHHIHPKFMDNPKGCGMKFPFCKKHHDILHLIIARIIWKYVPKHLKQKCINEVIKFTKRW